MYSIGNDLEQDVLPIITCGGTGILIGRKSKNMTSYLSYKDLAIFLDSL